MDYAFYVVPITKDVTYRYRHTRQYSTRPTTAMPLRWIGLPIRDYVPPSLRSRSVTPQIQPGICCSKRSVLLVPISRLAGIVNSEARRPLWGVLDRKPISLPLTSTRISSLVSMSKPVTLSNRSEPLDASPRTSSGKGHLNLLTRVIRSFAMANSSF